MLRLEFWPKSGASRRSKTWATIYHFNPSPIFGKFFAVFRRFQTKFTLPSPLYISGEKLILGKNILLCKEGGICTFIFFSPQTKKVQKVPKNELFRKQLS